MDLSTLKPFKGSRKARKRVGRGESSGMGKTAGKGTKGAQSRSGGGVRPGFEGGQTPIYRRLPKMRGFRALAPKDYEIVSLRTLNTMSEEVISLEVLRRSKLIKKGTSKIKVLATGKLERKLTVQAHYFSKKAVEIITQAGGSAEVVNG